MRKEFAEHFPHSQQSLSALWKNASFVFDANTLLNLYRYSDTARDEFIAVLREMKERICVPDQAAYEYFQNRTTEIIAQDKSYNDTKKMIAELSVYLSRDRGHPFISDDALSKLKSVLDDVCKELDQNQRKQTSRLHEDEIMLELAAIFENKVSRRFSVEELENVYVEGAKRFEAKIPPGYNDAKKHKDPQSNDEKRSVYGDLVIWYQIMDIANQSKSGVVFVTDDTKDDWWLEVSGKTIGPRPELVAEFSKTGQKFHMYKPEQFLKYAKDHLKSKVSSETLEEVAASRVVRAAPLDKFRDWTKEEVRNYQAHIAERHMQDGDASLLSQFKDVPMFRLKNGELVHSSEYSRAIFAPVRLKIEELKQRKRRLLNELVLLEARSIERSAEGESDYRKEVSAIQSELLASLNNVDDEIRRMQDRLKHSDDHFEVPE